MGTSVPASHDKSLAGPRTLRQQETGSVVGNGQRVAVVTIAELELAFEVGAPQIVGADAGG
jgi:hypothetical protein